MSSFRQSLRDKWVKGQIEALAICDFAAPSAGFSLAADSRGSSGKDVCCRLRRAAPREQGQATRKDKTSKLRNEEKEGETRLRIFAGCKPPTP